MSEVRTAFVCFFVFVSACSPPAEDGTDVGSGDAADVEKQDTGPVAEPPRDRLSPTVWETFQRLSPAEGIEASTDSTNRFAGDPRAVRLGQFLFFEPAISGDGEVACASCHRPDQWFADDTPLPQHGITAPDAVPGRRTPSLVNVSFYQWYFWDGRVDTLWGQAVAPYESSIEMGGSRLQLAHYVYDSAEVREAYEDLFGPLPARDSIVPFPLRGRPISDPQSPAEVEQDQAWATMREEDQQKVNQIIANVMKAVAAYEMELVSLDAPFDRFVDQVREAPEDPDAWDAISASAQRGAVAFVERGACLECHKGPLFTDQKFHNVGVPGAAWADASDPGRFEGVVQAKADLFSSAGEFSDDTEGQKAALLRAYPQRPSDEGAFRTTSLRNVAERAPYMHAGQLADLRAVMEFYNEPPDDFPIVGQRSSDVRALKLTDEQLDDLVAFMEALTGSPVDPALTSQPASPLLEQ